MLHAALPGLACLALTASCAEPANQVEAPPEPVFLARRQWALDGKPQHLLAADLDGDGHAELVAALQRGALVVWRGTAEGLDRDARTVAAGGWPLKPVALPAGAFGAAADTRLVALASRAERTVVLYDLVGDAAPREVFRGAGALDTPRTLAAGDLGGDGSTELALATDARQLVVVGENGGVATHALAHALPRCSAFRGDGAGVWVGFQDSRTLESVAGAPGAIALGGIPRDVLELDLGGVRGVLVVGGDRDARVFGVDGTSFLHWTTGLIPIDVEREGEQLVVLTLYGLSYEIGAKGAVRGYAGQTPTSLALADFTGDGALDLAIANRDARAVSLVRGDGAGGVLDVINVPVGVTPTEVVAGQLLGDELPEVVTLNSKSESASVLANEAGVLVPHDEVRVGSDPSAAVLTKRAPNEVVLVTRGANGAQLAVLRRAPDGALHATRPFPFGRSGLSACDLGLGAAGAEILVADADAGGLVGLHVPRDAWDTEWNPIVMRAPVPSAPVAIRTIELDGDPTPELAVALGSPGPRLGVVLLDLQRGTDALECRESALLEAAGWPVDVAVADLNGDERDDLVVLALEADGAVRGHVQTFVRAPDRLDFVAGEPQPTGARPHHLVVGDVDGDGLDDVFVDSQNSHVVNAWLTRSGKDGVRLRRLDDIGAHLGCYDVELADVDGDGRLDLLVANSFSDDVSVILNRTR